MPDRREWDVTGMDCAACVSKVKGALGQIAGVQNVEISLVSQKLRLTMDENAISVTKVEEMVRSLGYGIRRLNPATVADIVFAQDATNDSQARLIRPGIKPERDDLLSRPVFCWCWPGVSA